MHNMEQELKISELAKLWDVSVNTTWKRINKEGLLTTKKAVNNREIAFVRIKPEILQKYYQEHVNNVVNNPNYEELLRVNNTQEIPKTTTNSEEIIDRVIEYSKGVNEQLMTVTNNYTNTVNNLYAEKAQAEKQVYLLEDSERRTKAEINEIKANSKTLEEKNKKLLIIITGLCTVFIMVIIAMSYLLYKANTKVSVQEKQVTKVITVDSNGKPLSVLTEKQ